MEKKKALCGSSVAAAVLHTEGKSMGKRRLNYKYSFMLSKVFVGRGVEATGGGGIVNFSRCISGALPSSRLLPPPLPLAFFWLLLLLLLLSWPPYQQVV